MRKKLKQFSEAAQKGVGAAAALVGDLNGDGKVDAQDAQIAAEWVKRQAIGLGGEAARLGKAALRSDLAKDSATGAAIGAAIAIPVPLIGPAAGAAIGATVGAYRNLTGSKGLSKMDIAKPSDLHADLLKLQDLREKGILSEEEFQREKIRLLDF
nr:SHOCT domain-containing protein [uncultured Limnohabitans sp.]